MEFLHFEPQLEIEEKFSDAEEFLTTIGLNSFRVAVYLENYTCFFAYLRDYIQKTKLCRFLRDSMEIFHIFPY